MPSEIVNHYYSGQGSFYVGERDPNGRPKGLTRMGNVPEASVSIEVTKYEHKESESGQRSIDQVIVQERNGSFSMTVENLTLDNLAVGFWGKKVTEAEGEHTSEAATLFADARTPLRHPNIKIDDVTSEVMITVEWDDGGMPTELVEGDDYWVDAEHGVIWPNMDSAVVATAADPDGFPVTVTYTTAGYDSMIAFTETSMERFIRFEGINTITNKPVIVEMYRAQIDPLTDYGLINEELGSITLNGNLLFDGKQPGESKFFRQINL